MADSLADKARKVLDPNGVNPNASNADLAYLQLINALVGSGEVGPVLLTDNTGGTADNIVAGIAALANSPDLLTDAASRSEVNNRFTELNNDLADLVTKMNELRQEMIDAGLFT